MNEGYKKWTDMDRIAQTEYNDWNDCSVKMISMCCGVPYHDAYAAMELVGRKKNRGVSIQMMKRACSILGFEMVKIKDADIRVFKNSLPNGYKRKYLTPKNFLKYPKVFKHFPSVVAAYSSKHIAPIIDGEVIDWSEDGRNRLLKFWEVRLVQEAA